VNRKHTKVSALSKFRVVIAWGLVLAVLVSGSAMAGASGSGDGQRAAAAKKKCKKGKKCKKKPAAPVAPVAGASVPATSPATPPADGGGGDDVLFDITALSGTFDATVTFPDSPDCTITKDAHWTATLLPGADPARLVTFPDDNGSPLYIFNASQIPYTAAGSGVATVTCPPGPPDPSGTASCNFSLSQPLSATVSSDPEGSPDPINLEWFFGYNVFYYPNPANGGTCTASGSSPPSLSSVEDSPGLFVSPSNDGSNLLEPIGKSSVPLSTFNGDTTLNFSGSTSGASLSASWELHLSLHRR
jgi:hypothetical protein